MLVPTDGTAAVGAVTAGCLEGPVRNTATDVAAEGTPRVEVFDLTDDGDSWGLGLGCNGSIDLLVEPPERVSTARSRRWPTATP